jgi:hypothetical protein
MRMQWRACLFVSQNRRTSLSKFLACTHVLFHHTVTLNTEITLNCVTILWHKDFLFFVHQQRDHSSNYECAARVEDFKFVYEPQDGRSLANYFPFEL